MPKSRGSTTSTLYPIGRDDPLIAHDEGPVASLVNDRCAADIILICEHASKRIPRSLDHLGLDEEARSSHAAWDPGAEIVAREMSAILNAPLVLQNFSRLAYDCNRPPDAESAMPAKSEVFDIPGNQNLDNHEKNRRTDAIYRPFHAKIAEIIDRSLEAGRAPAIVTIHSFTPVFHGKARAVEIGLLHDADTRLVDAMLTASDGGDGDIRRNEPYGPKDNVTHTLQRHAIPKGFPNVMIEIRNDLLQTQEQQSSMARRMAELVREALGQLESMADQPPKRRRTAPR